LSLEFILYKIKVNFKNNFYNRFILSLEFILYKIKVNFKNNFYI